ncbi:hypothetical protein U4E84_02610 [Halorubrum sp. AD140]|uniref:DUF7344 domain-containing protein n=1 Tax=Halorubrum sp. AD140 TaxID=3050073 RepID=UPI002ACCB276|nr:hypothetical protein [Halorubrum sp. AD140]MDZ5810248.1 hypothetical protein [Halorubrum sp. AD140]
MVLSLDDEDEEQGDVSEQLSEDRVYDLLSASRRRVLLRYLDRNGGRAPFSDVTRAVAIAEGIDEDAAPSEYKHVYVSLYQSHVPKLADAGVLRHDSESKTLELTARADALFAHLNFVPPTQRQTLVDRISERLG